VRKLYEINQCTMQTWRDSNFIILNFSQRLKIISELKRFSFYLEKLQYPEFNSNLNINYVKFFLSTIKYKQRKSIDIK